MTSDARLHEFRPTVAGEIAGEEFALAPKFLSLRVHVVHEFVNQGDGDLLDLRLRVGDLADEDVAGGVDATFGFIVEHGGILRQQIGSGRRNL